MKIANDIINWLFQSGLLVWAFYFGFAVGKPWIENKIKHAKTAQQRETWALLEQVAMTTVNSLVSADKPGKQKFDEASTQVASYLSDHGIKMDMDTIQSAVQAAYEKSPLTTPTCESKPTKEKFSLTKAFQKLDQIQHEVDAEIKNMSKTTEIYTPVAPTPAPAPTPAGDPVMDAIAKAPNRANDVKEG